MSNYWTCAILFRIILPTLISIAAAIRPTITSFIYLLMGLYLPFFSVPTFKTMMGATGSFLKLFLLICILINSYVISFYFALFFPKGEDYHMEPCGTIEKLLRTSGVIEFRNLPIGDAVSWCLPEPLMLVTSVGLFKLFKKLNRYNEVDLANEETAESLAAAELHRKKLLALLLHSGKYFIVFWYCAAAVMKPSVQGSLYYLLFLIVMTYWACNKSLGKVYARILVVLTPVVVAHMFKMYLFQLQYLQDNEHLRLTGFIGKLFQMISLRTYKDCHDPRLFKMFDHSGPTYYYPFILFAVYQMTVLVSREILQAKDGIKGIFVAFFKREKKYDKESRWLMVFRKIKQQIQEKKISNIDKNFFADRIRGTVEQTIQFIMSISYFTANFIMMIWAITYINWKTMLLLMWANLVWLLPGRRRIMLYASPFLVAYVWFLLCLSYLYSMKLGIPREYGIFDFSAGSQSEDYWYHLLVKSLFSVIICITMRQLFQERALRRAQKNLDEAIAMGLKVPETDIDPNEIRSKSKTWRKIREIVKKWFALCWIWVVIITLIWMDFMSTSNPYRIFFVALAILAVMTFQACPFNCWKKFLRIYWWIVIVYAMFNLFVLYMHQLTKNRMFHSLFYGIEIFQKLGFAYESNHQMRFFILANPLFLQIAIVIQKNYLQNNFDKYTSPESPEELEEQQKELDEINPYVKKVITTCTTAKSFFFTFLEIHLQKVIILIGWLLCCFDWCAMFFPFVLLLTASCICGRLFTYFTIHLMSFFVEILILARLIYMNQYSYHHSWDYVGYYERNGIGYNRTLNTAKWLGFHESYDPNYADIRKMSWCFLFIFVVTLDKVVRIRQWNYRKARNMSTARQRILFPEINSTNCHDSSKSMVKFVINYGFYKLGVELTAVVAVVVLAIRMDAIAIVIALGLLMIFSLNRKWVERVLLPVMMLVGVWLPFQYAMSLGFWPTYWEYSPTRFWNKTDFKVRCQQFFHLMNMAHPPRKAKVVYDFILLMCFSRLWRMFRVMRQAGAQEVLAGSNENVGDMIDLEEIENPVPDYVTYSRNFLDVYKKLFFHSWFYISLLVTFLAGALRSTVYSFGYILAAFFLMWEGSAMFLRPPKRILFRWNLLITLNLMVLAFRTISQLFGCILVYEWTNVNCKIYSLFDVACVDRFGMTKGVPNMEHEPPCKDDIDAVGLQWDCVCFFFLIIQQRIFKSFHFFHIINDAKAQTILANRGALHIEDQRRKKRQAFDNLDTSIRKNIKNRLHRIEENRLKIQGDVYLRRKKNHKHMLRSGDYFLFDDVERSLDIPLMPPQHEEIDTEFDPNDPMPLDEFVNCFLTSGVDGVLDERALRIRQKQAVIEGKKPEDLNKALTPRVVRAGTSKEPPPKMEKSTVKKILSMGLFLWSLMESLVVSVTIVFNRWTRDFRFILNEMDKEKKLLKETTNYRQGTRVGSQKIWKPVATYSALVAKSATEDRAIKGPMVIRYSIYEKLLKSIWCLGLNQSEWLCYLVIILNQVATAQFISLPLPMMVFCWGALTVPKPTKTFWVISISYALIMSIIKNFFVMDLADWNKHTFPDNLFYPPTVIGIDRFINSFLSLTLLCSLFFHRVVLQWLGLWEPFSYRTSSLVEDGDYNFNDGKFVALEKNEPRKKNTVNIKSLEISMGDYFPRSIRHGAVKYAEGFRLFIQQLISPSSTQIPVDVYTPMFVCDLVNLMLIIFFYRYFETTDDDLMETDAGMGFVEFLQDNRVPVMYIGIVIAYFTMIVIDRWIYLRKNRFAKLVYHFFQVMSIHIWAFVLYPLLTGRLFINTIVVQLFYVFKCFYFLFSAYQIRNGYPHLISIHCMTHGTSLYHRLAFKLYRSIPYIFEMRTLLDWTCTDTSLSVADWFKMQEINDNIYDQKCQQDFESLMSDGGGERKNRTTKYFIGGFLFTALFLTIIFPFFLFSLGGSVGDTTHPAKISLELYMGSAEPIFNSYVSKKGMIQLTEDQYNNLTRTFNNIRGSESLFGGFKPEDVVVMKWSSHSLSSWLISPGSLKEMIEEAKTYEFFSVRLVIRFTHVGSGGTKSDGVFGQSTVIPQLPNPVRQDLINMLENGKSDRVVWIPMVFPKFLMITKEAKPNALPIMEEPPDNEEAKAESHQRQITRSGPIKKSDEGDDDDDDDDEERNPKRLRNLLLSLQSENGQFWWQVKEECDEHDDNYMYYLKDLVHNSCDELVIYTFNEKVFSGTMNYLTGSGIIGLYLIYFMVVYGFINGLMIDINEIWIEDLPNSDRLLRKCREVYIARDMQNYELEEELFSELIFIMRSREICIKLTRYDDDPYNPTYITPGTRRN